MSILISIIMLVFLIKIMGKMKRNIFLVEVDT